MDVPLGRNIGNSLEIIEAVETLNGNGPSDLREVSLLLCAKLLELAGKGTFEECKELAVSKIADGSALRRLAAMVERQGGNPDYILNPDLFEKAKYTSEVLSPSDGYIKCMNTEGIGNVCVELGAGRHKKEDEIDHSAGIILSKKTGDSVSKGEVLAALYASDKEKLSAACDMFVNAVEFSSSAPDVRPLLLRIVE